MARELNKTYTFESTRKAGTDFAVLLVEHGRSQELTQDAFLREYRKLKREHDSVNVQQGKPPSVKTGSFIGLGLDVDPTLSRSVLSPPHKDSQSVRKKKLQDALSDTLKLASKFEDQLKRLEAKGVRGEKAKK